MRYFRGASALAGLVIVLLALSLGGCSLLNQNGNSSSKNGSTSSQQSSGSKRPSGTPDCSEDGACVYPDGSCWIDNQPCKEIKSEPQVEQVVTFEVPNFVGAVPAEAEDWLRQEYPGLPVTLFVNYPNGLDPTSCRVYHEGIITSQGTRAGSILKMNRPQTIFVDAAC
jgi:hypothetical protein